MDRAAASVPHLEETPFRDGLGERHQTTDAAGVVRELLRLRPDLTQVPAFEFALRERVSRLAEFRHPYFAPARAVERLVDGDATLGLVSDRLEGFRLSDLFARAAVRGLNLDINAAVCLMRQVVPAIARFHEACRDVAHGALGPERVVLTANGRLMVTEDALGAALEQLHYSQERYWRDLRIAVPRSAGLPQFDERTDVTQIGVIALSLILGRGLREDEYPSRIADVVHSAKAIAPKGGFESLPPGLRTWIMRALQLDVRHSFATIAQANDELERVLAEIEYPGLPASVEAFLIRYHEADFAAAMAPAAVAAREPRPLDEFRSEQELSRAWHGDRSRGDLKVVVDSALNQFATEPVTSAPAPGVLAPSVAAAPPRTARTSPPPATSMSSSSAVAPLRDDAPAPGSRDLFGTPPAHEGGRWKLAVAIGLLLACGAAYGPLSRQFRRSPPAAPTGTLVVKTPQPGTTALLDGRALGITPLTVTVAAGPHTLELLSAGTTKTVPVTITGGARVEQYIEMPVDTSSDAAPSPGVPEVLALPVITSAPVASTAPGPKPVRAASPAGESAVVIVGESNGLVSVNALPWADVWIDGAPVGETPIGNLALPIGTHEVLLRHPDHGEQHHTVTVTSDRVARLSVDLRR